MKILLLSPNTLTQPYPVYPLGLDYVAGALEAAGGGRHALRRADLNVIGLAELESMLQDFEPELIGIACRNIDNTEIGAPRSFIAQIATLAAWLRRRSMAILVAGGSAFTIMPQRIFTELGVDYGIIGEGERLALLVDALMQGQNPSALPGVLAPGREAHIPPPWPGERRRALPTEYQALGFYLKKGGMLNLQTKRGCVFRCIYCPYPHIEGKQHRLTPAAQVAQEALSLQQAGAKYLFITDSAFNSDLAHSMAVAQAFKEVGLGIPWGAFFAPLKAPRGYFQLMAEAGCQHVEFGTESLSETMLARYRKPFQRQDVLLAHAQALAAGLHVAHYFLLGGPGECLQTLEECLDAVEQLPRSVAFFFTGIRIYPGTALYDIAREEGKISAATDLLPPLFYQSEALSPAEIEAVLRRRAAGRINWIIGSGGEQAALLVSRLHERGRIGPLWEHLIR